MIKRVDLMTASAIMDVDRIVDRLDSVTLQKCEPFLNRIKEIVLELAEMVGENDGNNEQ